MEAEKKCPHCQQWTTWSRKETDTCLHCGEILLLHEIIHEQKKEEDRKRAALLAKAKWPFDVKPNDPLLLKSIKLTGKALHAVFIAIMSFILWIVFWLAS